MTFFFHSNNLSISVLLHFSFPYGFSQYTIIIRLKTFTCNWISNLQNTYRTIWKLEFKKWVESNVCFTSLVFCKEIYIKCSFMCISSLSLLEILEFQTEVMSVFKYNENIGLYKYKWTECYCWVLCYYHVYEKETMHLWWTHTYTHMHTYIHICF